MVESLLTERSTAILAEKLIDLMRKEQPDITDAEIKEAACNFVGFIRVLKEMDLEQKAK
jgi:hypothetical protein